MAFYRISRNIEASIIEHINNVLFENNWQGVTVEKTFAKVYDSETPIICIRVGDTNIERAEQGSDAIYRTVQVYVDLFASSDGQRLDLKDFLIDELKAGLPYYEYAVEHNDVTQKTQRGRLSVSNIEDTTVDFNTDKSSLDKRDRYRHKLILTVSTYRIEV